MRSIKYIIPRALRKIFNPPAIDKSKLSKTSKCDIGAIVNHSTLGRYSYIGEHTSLLFTDVGAFCSISNYCAIGGASHPSEWVSTSPAFNNTGGMMSKKIGLLPYTPFVRTTIGNDVWIGSHCLIRGGVYIGDGAIIGMGSVVTHDVGAYEIWAGNPAKCIKKRFDDETIKKLLDIRWWEFEDDELKKYSGYFNEIDEFVSQMMKSNNDCEENNFE